MSLSEMPDQTMSDPKAPLSTSDLAKLLMQYCDNRMRMTSSDCKDSQIAERDSTNEKIQAVVKGFSDSISLLRQKFGEEHHHISALVTDVELKLSTVSSYLEHHLNSLRHDFENEIINKNSHNLHCSVNKTIDASQSS